MRYVPGTGDINSTTIFAVGYGELHPLSGPGRILTMALIGGGIVCGLDGPSAVA